MIALTRQTDSPAPAHEPLEMPTPPADADLNATEGILMASVIGELRVTVSAIAVLERVEVQPTKPEAADRVNEDRAKGSGLGTA